MPKRQITIRLYNVRTRKKELFKPLKKGRVGFYACGPTVYNFAHIGNLRTYIFEDVLRRTLEYAGYKVRQVMNITDVDDKIIREASAKEKTIFEFVKPYEQAFFNDLESLGIEKAWKYPRATLHIPEMVRLIARLLKKGIAYTAEGSVYFAIKSFRRYGKLSRIASRKLKAGARVEADEYTKQNVQDFVLWKAYKQGEPSWPAPFGKGRPGWHIECSAMSMKYLGNTFDIHAGGIDLLFPHHENEIAQSEAATDKPFVRFFVEAEHLLVDGAKMSKSLGNVFTLRDLEARGVSPLAFRYLCLTSHYRSKLNFTWESLEGAEQSLKKLYEFVHELKEDAKRKRCADKKLRSLDIYKKKFEQALFDDLNMPKALAVVWNTIHSYHKSPELYDAKEVLAFLCDFDHIMGLNLANVSVEAIPSAILDLVQKREFSRNTKDWKQADEIRNKIKKEGYIIEDSSEGPKVKKI